MSKIRHATSRPFVTLFKSALAIALLCLIVNAAYAQGVRHAIETAMPFVENDAIMIDYDGQIHEYR